jgi:hypothetical protein
MGTLKAKADSLPLGLFSAHLQPCAMMFLDLNNPRLL